MWIVNVLVRDDDMSLVWRRVGEYDLFFERDDADRFAEKYLRSVYREIQIVEDESA